MAYKTLKRILNQNKLWSGSDLGKALIYRDIEILTGKTPSLTLEDISLKENDFSSPKQKHIYLTYQNLSNNINAVYSAIKTIREEFNTGYLSLNLILDNFITQDKIYKEYLKTPLLIEKQELESFKNEMKKIIENTETTAHDFIVRKIYEILDIYKYGDRNLLEPELINILTSYEQDTFITQESFIKHNFYELESVIERFSEIYKTENNKESITQYIKDDKNFNLELTASKVQFEMYTKELTSFWKLIESYDYFKECEKDFFNDKFKSINHFNNNKKYLHSQKIKTSKFKELNNLGDFTAYNSDSMDLSNYPIGSQSYFLENYKELYLFVKNDLSKKLDIFNSSIKDLAKLKLKLKDLYDANILDKESLENYSFDLEKSKSLSYALIQKDIKTLKDFIIKEKSDSGIAIKLTPAQHEKELFEKYSKNAFIPEDFNLNELDDEKRDLIPDCLKIFFNYNKFLELYSECFEIDLTPLRIDTEPLYKDCSIFNTKLFLFYHNLIGDQKTLNKNKKLLKKLFKPYFVDDYKTDLQRFEQVRNKVKAIAQDELIYLTADTLVNSIINGDFDLI